MAVDTHQGDDLFDRMKEAATKRVGFTITEEQLLLMQIKVMALNLVIDHLVGWNVDKVQVAMDVYNFARRAMNG